MGKFNITNAFYSHLYEKHGKLFNLFYILYIFVKGLINTQAIIYERNKHSLEDFILMIVYSIWYSNIYSIGNKSKMFATMLYKNKEDNIFKSYPTL